MANSTVGGRRYRQRMAHQRLESQMVMGTKQIRINEHTVKEREPLTDGDIKRIEKEMKTLQSSLNG